LVVRLLPLRLLTFSHMSYQSLLQSFPLVITIGETPSTIHLQLVDLIVTPVGHLSDKTQVPLIDSD